MVSNNGVTELWLITQYHPNGSLYDYLNMEDFCYFFIKLMLSVTYMLKPWFIVVRLLAHERLDREENTEETLSCAPGRACPCAGGRRESGEGGEKGREGREGGERGRGEREGGERGRGEREGREGGRREREGGERGRGEREGGERGREESGSEESGSEESWGREAKLYQERKSNMW